MFFDNKGSAEDEIVNADKYSIIDIIRLITLLF